MWIASSIVNCATITRKVQEIVKENFGRFVTSQQLCKVKILVNFWQIFESLRIVWDHDMTMEGKKSMFVALHKPKYDMTMKGKKSIFVAIHKLKLLKPN